MATQSLRRQDVFGPFLTDLSQHTPADSPVTFIVPDRSILRPVQTVQSRSTAPPPPRLSIDTMCAVTARGRAYTERMREMLHQVPPMRRSRAFRGLSYQRRSAIIPRMSSWQMHAETTGDLTTGTFLGHAFIY